MSDIDETILNKTNKNEKLCCRESNEAQITKALGLHKNFVFCFVFCSFICIFAENMKPTVIEDIILEFETSGENENFALITAESSWRGMADELEELHYLK